jgi:signal transduction histidine kinase
LQTILGLADLHLERAQEEGDALLASDLSTIIGAAEFIEHIATDILDLRRVEEGKVQIEKTEVDVGQIAVALGKAMQPLLAKKPEVEFKVNVEPEIRVIRTDRYRVQQILMNFLTNAYKHTDAGVITLSVSLAGSEWLRFAVWDTGKGIAEEKRQSLFAEFAQVSAKDASDLGGFGLGLYLTKMLAALLGGSVGFESTLGLGSVFWVDLPTEFDRENLSVQFQKSEIKMQRLVGLPARLQ